MVSLDSYLVLSAVIFSIGVFGFLTRRSAILMFMSVELMLNAVNISLVALSHYMQDLRGHVMVVFIITVAAAEAAIGLAILITLFRSRVTAHVDEISLMKG